MGAIAAIIIVCNNVISMKARRHEVLLRNAIIVRLFRRLYNTMVQRSGRALAGGFALYQNPLLWVVAVEGFC